MQASDTVKRLSFAAQQTFADFSQPIVRHWYCCQLPSVPYTGAGQVRDFLFGKFAVHITARPPSRSTLACLSALQADTAYLTILAEFLIFLCFYHFTLLADCVMWNRLIGYRMRVTARGWARGVRKGGPRGSCSQWLHIHNIMTSGEATSAENSGKTLVELTALTYIPSAPPTLNFRPFGLHPWRRSIVVRTLVSAGELSLSCGRLLAGWVTTLWLSHPLSVSQHGQLSLPSLMGR